MALLNELKHPTQYNHYNYSLINLLPGITCSQDTNSVLLCLCSSLVFFLMPFCLILIFLSSLMCLLVVYVLYIAILSLCLQLKTLTLFFSSISHPIFYLYHLLLLCSLPSLPHLHVVKLTVQSFFSSSFFPFLLFHLDQNILNTQPCKSLTL